MSTVTSKDPIKTKHYLFLSPYEDCAFTKCPKCDGKTKLRKFPLVIHIEPHQLFVLNKKCKYCTTCDLIITKKSEVESLMAYRLEDAAPSIIGNEYVVFGTLDRSDWQEHRNSTTDSTRAMEQVYIFKDIWNFELVRGGWGP